MVPLKHLIACMRKFSLGVMRVYAPISPDAMRRDG